MANWTKLLAYGVRKEKTMKGYGKAPEVKMLDEKTIKEINSRIAEMADGSMKEPELYYDPMTSATFYVGKHENKQIKENED